MATGFFYAKHGVTSGAPDLTNVAGSLITVLDWLLDVTNANSRKVATKSFTGTNKAVYRFDAAGTRHYLRVDDNYTIHARVRAYESMTDVDTGTDPYPLIAQDADDSFLWHKSSAVTARTWRAVVTNRTIQMVVPTDGALLVALNSFGEHQSLDATDTWCSAICGYIGTGAYSGANRSYFANTNVMFATAEVVSAYAIGAFARRYDGVTKSTRAIQMGTMNNRSITTASTYGCNGHLDFSALGFGGSTISPVYLKDVAAESAGAMNNPAYYIRCKIPHIYTSAYLSQTAGAQADGTIVTIAGTDYEMIASRSLSGSNDGYIMLMKENDEPGLP